MATIYPDVLPLEIRHDPRRTAERIIYTASKKLGNSFRIFYSSCWRRSLSYDRKQSGFSIGECDFIFLSAEYGVLCVECKGGAVSHNQSGFHTTDKRGNTYSIKNPYAQALRSKYYLIDHLSNLRKTTFLKESWSEYIRHATFFPESLDTGWMKDDLSFSREITGFAPDVSELNQWLDRVFGGPLSARGLEKLIDSTVEDICSVLSPISACQFTHATSVRDTEEYFGQALVPTSQQWYLIDQLSFRRKGLIIGAAGTGKTVVVLEYLKRNCTNKNRSVFLCASATLATDIRERSPELLELFQIKSLSEYICDLGSLCKEYGISYHGMGLSQMLDMLATKTSFRYDILVIDEAQDLDHSEQHSLSRLVRRGGQFICCYDPEQRPFNSDFPIQTASEMGFDSVDTLTYNVRNTPEILNYFLSHCPSKTVWRSLAPSGAPVKEIQIGRKGLVNLVEIINSVLDELDVSPRMITLLFKEYDDLFTCRMLIREAIESRNVSPSWGALRSYTIVDFKGLESSVVLVWDPKSLDETLFYIACSRARSSLYLLMP